MDGVAFSSDGAEAMGSWIDQELVGCRFADVRLGKRLGVLLKQLSGGLGRTIPLAYGDWAATKAAYRFLDNDRVGEAEMAMHGRPRWTSSITACVCARRSAKRNATQNSTSR